MPTYVVKTPLRTLDGIVDPGETIDLPAKEGEELLACGAVEPGTAKPQGENMGENKSENKSENKGQS